MKMVELEQVCVIKNGYAFKSEEYKTEGAPLLRISNFNDGDVCIDEDSIYVDTEYLKSKSDFIVEKGDILIALSGATTGKYGFYNYDYPSLLNQRVGLLKSGASKELNDRYFYHYLNILKSEILRNAGGAAQPNISTNSIGKFQIPLPSLETQKKIAAILDAADVYRQKTKTLIEKYDQLAQSLFLDMFGDTWSNPKGWKVMFVEEVANNKKHSIKAGPFGSSLKKEFYVERGYKIYGQEQVIKDDLSFGDYYIDERKFKELENCKVSEGDVLISLVGTYGKISVVPENFEPGIINPRLMKISPNKNIIRPDFLKKLLQNSGAKIQMKNQSRGGTMDIINVGIMRKIEIPVPPIQLQNQFADRIQLIERQKQQAQASLKKAEDLFNSLLQRAFKGELVS
jgi:type I restriction enzyme S subunit